MGNEGNGETDGWGPALDRLSRLLPETWTLVLDREPKPGGSIQFRPDGILRIASPKGPASLFAVEAKMSPQVSAGLLVAAASHVAELARLPGVVITQYANPALRAACLEANLGYVDTTGWVYLRDDRRGLLVTGQGASRAPGRARPTSMVRLSGPGATQVIQTLFDARLPLGVRELAAAADVSPGTVAKVLPALEQAGAIDRTRGGQVASCDRSGLLDRWIQDYGFTRSNRDVTWLLAPRGLDGILTRLRDLMSPETNEPAGLRFAATGSLAARRLLPQDTLSVTPLALACLYCADPSDLTEQLRLRPATRSTANVVLARPQDDAILTATELFDGYLRLAPRARVLADLLTLGGRYVDEAGQLLESISADDQPVGSGT